jgi:hypothetical protein
VSWDELMRLGLDYFYEVYTKDPRLARIQLCSLFAGVYGVMGEVNRIKTIELIMEVRRQFHGKIFEDIQDFDSFISEQVQDSNQAE